MTDAFNDILYTASLIEYVARETKNKRRDIAQYLGVDGIRSLYELAPMNHCLTFPQVSDETIDRFNIHEGTFAPEKLAKTVPSIIAIGKNYARLVEDAQPDETSYPEELYNILMSKVSEWMTEYNSAFYYSPRDYLLLAYRGELE